MERLVAVIAPHDCLRCGREGKVLCDWCMSEDCLSSPERCYRCKKLTTDSRVCASCKRSSSLRHVWVRSEYDDAAKGLVHKLKFARAQAAAAVIAEMIAETLPYLPPDTLVTHIPTATSRYRQRGYDHAQLIAKHIAVKKGLRYASLLIRSGQSRQVGAKRDQRLKQLAGAYRSRSGHLIEGAHILLVDDVVTTGATIEEAGKTLRLAGARQVSAAIFAQKQ
jgi:ComF family protein